MSTDFLGISDLIKRSLNLRKFRPAKKKYNGYIDRSSECPYTKLRRMIRKFSTRGKGLNNTPHIERERIKKEKEDKK
jgi:hypothetical protein